MQSFKSWKVHHTSCSHVFIDTWEGFLLQFHLTNSIWLLKSIKIMPWTMKFVNTCFTNLDIRLWCLELWYLKSGRREPSHQFFLWPPVASCGTCTHYRHPASHTKWEISNFKQFIKTCWFSLHWISRKVLVQE